MNLTRRDECPVVVVAQAHPLTTDETGLPDSNLSTLAALRLRYASVGGGDHSDHFLSFDTPRLAYGGRYVNSFG